MDSKNKLGFLRLMFISMLACCISAMCLSGYNIAKYRYFPSPVNIRLVEWVDYQQDISSVVNEETIIKFLSRYPDAVIEEIISGNKYVLFDLFSRWEKRRFPEERFFWGAAGYKIGMMLRVNPELLLEAMAKSAKVIIDSCQ
ncbi:MAG: hypothetical protein ACP5SQ_08415 [Candidatus Saccharicenans sp.]